MEQIARRPFRARPDADRQQHDIHHAEAPDAQRAVQALAFLGLLPQRIVGHRLRLEPEAQQGRRQRILAERRIVPDRNPLGREIGARGGNAV